MDTVLIVARAALVLVFLTAALAKLADRQGSYGALEDFRVPQRFLPVAVLALPIAELMAAILLIFGSTAVLGGLLCLLLLAGFIAGIAAALRRGETPDCHCFGQIHSEPAGQPTIWRNVALAAVAALVVVAGGGPSIGDWWTESSGDRIGLAATSLLALSFGYIALELWRDKRRTSGRPSPSNIAAEPAVGDVLPAFSVRDEGGREVGPAELVAEQRTILVFTSSTCGPCIGLLPELARWRDMLTGRLTIHVLAAGDEDRNRELAETHGMAVFLDAQAEAANACGVTATPTALEIGPDRRVASPSAAGAPAIEALIRSALKRPTGPPELSITTVGG